MTSAAPSARAPVRVLIVDDSPLVRRVLADVISLDPDLEVSGLASDPFEAVRLIGRERPDVIVLDIEMPRMDGITFLRKLMSQHPIPTVICSTLAERGSRAAMAALGAGAIDLISKPKVGAPEHILAARDSIARVLKSAALAKPARIPLRAEPARPAVVPAAAHRVNHSAGRATLIVIGASTGGVEALREVLMPLPRQMPPILVVQHMPEGFTQTFAAWLDGTCALDVREAKGGERLVPSQVLVARGGHHLMVRRNPLGELETAVTSDPPVNRHRPSVDVLFSSVAAVMGRGVAAVVLTGMGDDGARGLVALRQAGAATVAQDEATSVVFGMPKEAVRLGGTDLSLPLREISAWLQS